MADIKEMKRAIWLAKDNVTKIETTRNEWAVMLPELIAFCEAEPSPELLASKNDVEAQIEDHDRQLVAAREELAALRAQLPTEPEPAPPKFDPEKHPLLKKTLEKSDPALPVVFNTGDTCEAQWTDKAWYKAKIMTILGSGSMQKYHVKFLEYDDTLTVDRDAVRPVQQKRKHTEPAPVVATATSSSAVISAPAVVNANSQLAQPAESAEPQRKKKKAAPEFNKRVNSWKDWNTKGTGKKIAQKESMFRTGTGVNSRVGVTGSGAGMTTTHRRIRYDKKADEKLDTGEER